MACQLQGIFSMDEFYYLYPNLKTIHEFNRKAKARRTEADPYLKFIDNLYNLSVFSIRLF